MRSVLVLRYGNDAQQSCLEFTNLLLMYSVGLIRELENCLEKRHRSALLALIGFLIRKCVKGVGRSFEISSFLCCMVVGIFVKV